MTTLSTTPSTELPGARAGARPSALSGLGGLWRRLPATAKAGLILLAVFVLAAIIGPQVAPYAPGFSNPDPNVAQNAPSAAHLLGTTATGQDVLSQLLIGIRLTLELAFWVGVVATALSVIVGVTAAFLGGAWDEVLMLVTNVFLVIPALPLLIMLLGLLPQKGQFATILVLAALGWPWGARVIRAQTLMIRNRDFIAAARETGERGWRVILFEIIPNEVSLIAASFVNTVLYAIAASVALAFVGLAPTSVYSLGTMLYWAESANALQQTLWWWYIPPGLAVALIGTALVLLNTGIDELGNPRLRDARSATKIAGRRVWPTDPTPVLATINGRRGGLASFVHSFSRDSLLDEAPVNKAPLDKAGEL